ncbi:biogenesis of lysosome-related organelles complex 1 subunit 5 isoform X1 [Vombatus ursinus]|uniref:Biogenesis of lysosome-related organelles complex 1 subunit 5 n=1 Tax=Vombatus ursinus TaxID=29139 RepID=A0A4X2JYB6_VOMUR|nr:biogenesis of lysosome-related organelles complex 1 subunit 5 isoform X1 [Vombatus ursinus]
MSGGGTEAPSGGEGAPTPAAVPVGGKKRDSQGPASSPVHLIIKDLGEIHSRLLDHRPIIQGETRYFVKEFEEKRGLREVRVLENLKNVIQETNEQILPKCRETMQDHLSQALQRLQAASHLVHKLQQKEQEQRKLNNQYLLISEKQRITQWEDFMKEQHNKQAAVDEEHKKATERLKEQYAEMEKDLAKFSSF